MAVIVPAAIAAGVGIYNIAHGAAQQKKAARLAAANTRPVYNTPQGDYDNLNLAKANASQGLADSSKQIYLDGSQQGLDSALSTILKGGGDANNASSLYDSYLGGLSNVTLADNAQKVANVNTFMNARYRIGNQQDKEFQVNKFGPYADQQQMIAQMRGNGVQMEQSGIGTVAGAAMSLSAGEAGIAKAKAAGKIDPGTSTEKTEKPAVTVPVSVQVPQNVSYANNQYSSAGSVNDMGYNGGINKAGGRKDNYIAPVPYSTGQPSNGSGNNYGIDISKLNPNDAAMVSSILYGNVA